MSSHPIKILVITSCLMALLITSCRYFSVDGSQCPIGNLLINSTDLPGDQWEEVGSRSYRDAPSKLGNERIGTGFSTPRDGIAEENVYRFGSESDATDGYIELGDLWHRLEPRGTEWSRLDLPANLSIAANEHRVECSVSSQQSLRTCWYIARYGQTVIEFRTAMIIVEEDNLFNIISILDQKVAICGES